jgi:hypothetical protein
MTLPEKLAALRQRAMADLDAVERYFQDSELAFRLVGELAAAPAWGGGNAVSLHPTGTSSPVVDTAEAARPELIRLSGLAQGYVAGNLTEATFQQTLAVFEAFVADLLTTSLLARPDTLGGRDVKLIRVLRDGGAMVVAEEVNQVVLTTMTGGPRQWFDALAQHARVPARRPTGWPGWSRPRPPATCWSTTAGSSARST